MADHAWEPPPVHWLDRSNWSPGACAHRATSLSAPCGVHVLDHAASGPTEADPPTSEPVVSDRQPSQSATTVVPDGCAS